MFHSYKISSMFVYRLLDDAFCSLDLLMPDKKGAHSMGTLDKLLGKK
jgi:hypothetical protein